MPHLLTAPWFPTTNPTIHLSVDPIVCRIEQLQRRKIEILSERQVAKVELDALQNIPTIDFTVVSCCFIPAIGSQTKVKIS